MVKKISIILVLLPFLVMSFLRTASVALAESIEITVSGNSSGSENTANVTVENNTSVTQNNEANVENNAETNANTGNNSASNNNGDSTNIDTGSIASSSEITNEMNNNTAIDCDCEVSSSEINISGNGAGSENLTDVKVGKSTNVSQNNTANITNRVTTNANTGNNSANYNLGNVNIQTGNITNNSNITNKNINENFIKGFSNASGSLNINVAGNGVFSDNRVFYADNSEFNYVNNNFFNLESIIINNLNTGGNSAIGNLGDVWIKTGDIVSVISIVNEGNSNHTEITSCDTSSPTSSNPPGKTENPALGGSSVSSSSGGNGQVMGVSTGSSLPATGSLWVFIMTILAIGVFISGWYLRFKSGVSPPSAKVV